MRNEPWVWPEVRDAGTSGAGAVPLRSAQLMGQQKKKKNVFATLAARLQLLQVVNVLKLALLAWSRTLDLKGAGGFSGVFVSLPSACILFSSDSVPSDFCNTIHRERECVLPCFCVWSKGLSCGIRTLLPSLGLQSSTLTSHH